MAETNTINLERLNKYIDAFIMFEIGNHGVDPRESLDGTSMRLTKDEGYKYEAIRKWELGSSQGKPLFERIAEATHYTNFMDYHSNSMFNDLLNQEGHTPLGDALEYLYTGDDDAAAFDKLVQIIGARFDILGFLYFFKDYTKYMPIRSLLFDERFQLIGIDSQLSFNCSWEKYLQYNQWTEHVSDVLRQQLNPNITLIDANSFLWILPLLAKYIDSGIQAVEHNAHGKGIVLGFEGDSIRIKFGDKERKFMKESAFKKGLLRFIPTGTDIYGRKIGFIPVDKETRKRYAEEDEKLIADLKVDFPVVESNEARYKGGIIKKPEPTMANKHLTYPANRTTSANALAIANYHCEIDFGHPTFISKSSGKPYMEPHHLVPRAYQEQFEVLIDREENLVSLCSTCHNEIHYGRDARDLIEILYESRKELLKTVGIDITLEQLLEMYE